MPQRSQPISEEEAVATRASVSKLIKHVLTARNTGVFEKHIRDVLDTLLWKYTEASGKYSTRYYSAASAGQPQPLLLSRTRLPEEKDDRLLPFRGNGS